MPNVTNSSETEDSPEVLAVLDACNAYFSALEALDVSVGRGAKSFAGKSPHSFLQSEMGAVRAAAARVSRECDNAEVEEIIGLRRVKYVGDLNWEERFRTLNPIFSEIGSGRADPVWAVEQARMAKYSAISESDVVKYGNSAWRTIRRNRKQKLKRQALHPGLRVDNSLKVLFESAETRADHYLTNDWIRRRRGSAFRSRYLMPELNRSAAAIFLLVNAVRDEKAVFQASFSVAVGLVSA